MKLFSLLYQGDVHFTSDAKIIPSEQIATLITAEKLVEKAKEDTLKLQQKTAAECEELKKQAYEEGFAKGLESFNEHLVQFEKELIRLRHDTQKAVLPLALKAAKKIVAKELEQHPETIVDIVMQVLAPIRQNHKVKIFVNKGDKEHLEKEKARLREVFESLQSLSIQERDDVSPGGCIIETESGIINASIENQWRALERAFETYMKAKP
jgi:type III secretion protein L